MILFMLLLLVAFPMRASAHASLTNTVPEANSRLAQGPGQIVLEFNERLEKELYSITVLDSSGKSVTGQAAVMNENQHGISLQVPNLGEGVYAVSYHVISADGHPVDGSYVFTVGNPPPGKDASLFDVHKQLGHEGHEAHEFGSQLTVEQFLVFASRVLYYAALLFLLGFVIWNAFFGTQTEELRRTFRAWGLQLQRVQLLALLALVFLQSRELLAGQPTSEWLKLYTGTGVGISWLISAVLTLLGFVLLMRSRWLDAAWVVAMAAAKSMSGHAASYEPKALVAALDAVHLLAASLWAGGVLLIAILWRSHREALERFAPRFSGAALVSIAVLAVSGAVMTLLFLPSLSYLLFTQWGTLLIAKVTATLLVVAVGAGLRWRLKRRSLRSSGGLFKTDFALLCVIVLIVGLLTYLSPLPSNKPLYWHEMGNTRHLSVEITPNVPGINEITVKVWLPPDKGEPKRVSLLLTPLEGKEVAPIEVPIEPYKDEKDATDFTGFNKFDYKAKGPYIPFPGKWLVELHVTDRDDNEVVNDKTEMRNY